ncbi:MAG: hypothetical protein JW388_0666 [Nitrospira sp.]|nr:hypothetical protein [Nitrospira sp.]
MEHLFIVLAIVFLIFLIWQPKGLLADGVRKHEAPVLPFGVTLRSQPLLTDRDLVLYNLILLAVQDHFLVFARVPLWSIVSVEGDRKARLQVLRKIALKQLDFVLFHPGSKVVEQVVLLEEGTPPQPEEIARRQEIQLVLQAAGIRLTLLDAHTSYTVFQLAQLLGLGSDE